MPEQNDITIMTDQASRAKPEVGSFRSTMGNDTAEVSELREYQEGDELKAIHWKLTSKMDRLIVREYSDSTRYDTHRAVYDIALKANGEDVDKTLLSTSIGAVESLSRALVRAEFRIWRRLSFRAALFRTHCSGGRCRRVPLHAAVLSAGGEQRHRLSVFLAGQIQQNYESMVYFTIHSFPKELALIPADVNLMP